MSLLDDMRAKRAAKPQCRGSLVVPAGNRGIPLYYWSISTLTLGGSQAPAHGRPYPFEAWMLLQQLADESPDGLLPCTLGKVQDLVTNAHKAFLAHPESHERAMMVLRTWMRVLPVEVVLRGDIRVHVFNKLKEAAS